MTFDYTSRGRAAGIEAGALVLVVLHSPREKCWGRLDEISAAGVFLRGLDLNAFEDWMRAVTSGEPFIAPGDQFFPMWRVERVTRDETTGGLLSLAEQFEARTGHNVREFLDDGLDDPVN